MRIELSGYQIGYEDRGQGTPLLLMHAFPFHRGMFEPQREELAKVCRLITFDAPGVGESSPGRVPIDGIAGIAAGLLDALGIGRAIVGGVSMGGYAAFSFARRHAERLTGLVLANTRVAADNLEAKTGRREMAELARQQGAGEIANRMLPRLLGPTTRDERPEVVRRVRELIESVPPEAMAALLEAMAGRADSSDLLERIEVPALVIAGDEDAIAPPDESFAWARKIPGMRFIRIGRAGHLCNLEAPEAFNAALTDFLQGIPQRASEQSGGPAA